LTEHTASGFDFEPLPGGNVLVEFVGDNGTTVNTQIVTAEVVRRMPLVAALLDVAVRMGPEAAREIVERLNVARVSATRHEPCVARTTTAERREP
jgi:hypothetical protein